MSQHQNGNPLPPYNLLPPSVSINQPLKQPLKPPRQVPTPSPSLLPRLNPNINTLHRSSLSPSSDTQLSSPCPPYLLELAQADRRLRSGFISREPSLPSLMSLPPTRPVSPDPLPNSPRTTPFPTSHLATQPFTTTSTNNNNPNTNHTSHNPISISSNPTSPHLSRRFFTRSSARGLSSLCMFEDGLQHYERLRTPSLRGHSRRTSLIHSIPDNQQILKAQLPSDEMFELDLSDDFAEQTLRPTRWSDDDEDEEEEEEEEEEDDDDDDDDDDHHQHQHFLHSENQSRHDRESGTRGTTRKLFKVGDRVGVGTIHQGYRVRDLFDAAPASSPKLGQSSIQNHGGSGILEIVRQIGVGSYAVVYLVREVLYDPDLESESALLDSTLSQTPKASDGFASLSAFEKAASSRRGASSQVVYGKDFALKCLCKRNLSDELLVLQRGEAELHRSLPLHDHIVALHRALETPNWLFLVIEYCPGQDLFYWLEQARDSQDLESMSSRTTSCAPNLPGFADIPLSPLTENTGDDSLANLSALSLNTPPSPSLLATTADDEMLSRRRLRLISKMFVQMCDAVEACHQAGVCHRDIKPENFIVVDDRKGRSSDSWKAQSTETQVGPRSSVIVKITDWGLGTSSKACEDFDCGSKPYMAYECRNNLNPTYDPVQADIWSLGIVLLNLLYHRCPWADPTGSDLDFAEFQRGPVRFLRSRFEGMTESVASFLADKIFCEVGHNHQRRISAGQFGEWARSLLQHMGGGLSHASVSNATVALSPSSARGAVDQRRSIRRSSPGLLSKLSAQLIYPIDSSNSVPEVFQSSIKFPETIVEGVTKPSPLLTPINLPTSVSQDLPPSMESPGSAQEDIFMYEKVALDAWPINNALDVKVSSEPTEILADEVLSVEAHRGTTEATGDDEEATTPGSKIGSDKSKRRKRGARKGRKVEAKQNGSTDPESASPTSERTEVDMLDGLAEASQSLAREISQATRTMKPSDEVTTTKRKMNIAERMMEKFRDGSNPDLQAFVARARAREAAYMGKVKSNTTSAPAQLQEISKTTGPNNAFLRTTAMSTSSLGIGSTMSTHSSSTSTSWGNSSDYSSFSKPSSTTHWSSASNRRDRIQKTFIPLSNSVAGSSSAACNLSTATLGSRKDHGGTTATLIQNKNDTTHHNNVPNHHPNKKEESKNKLAQLLTSFKRYNSTVGNHLSSTPAATTTTTTTAYHSTPNHVSAPTIPTSSFTAAAIISPFKVDTP